MATSGTTDFNPDVATLIEEAFDRAGYEGRSGYEYRMALRTLNFLTAEWANLGLNLWTVEQGSQALTIGDGDYTLPADTIDVIDYVIRDSNNKDYRIERIGVGSWAALNDKFQRNRPSQIFVERLVDAPVVHLWPVPNDTYTLVYWRLRRIQDAGTPSNTMDIPYRFMPAMAAGLAYYLAMKKFDVTAARLDKLEQNYKEQLDYAMAEDRGRESFWIHPQAR